MTATYTARLRATLQGVGDNLDTWGDVLNQQTIQLLEDAVARRVALTVSGAVTLTTSDGATDQARCAFLDCTGTGGTITIPTVEKLYLLRNGTSGDVVVTTGGTTNATLKPGNVQWVVSDGANVYRAQERDLGSDLLSTTADPTADDHLARKAYVDAQITATEALVTAEAASRVSGDADTLSSAKTYTDATSFAAGSLPGGGTDGQLLRRIAGPSADWHTLDTDDLNTMLPAQAAAAGKFLQSDGTDASWADIRNLALAKSADYTLDAADRYKVLELTSSATLTLLAAATAADGFVFYAHNAGTGAWVIDPNSAETIDGRSAIVVYPNERFLVISDGSAWRTVGRARRWLVETASPSAASAAAFELAFTANNGSADLEMESLDFEGQLSPSTGAVGVQFKFSGAYLTTGSYNTSFTDCTSNSVTCSTTTTASSIAISANTTDAAEFRTRIAQPLSTSHTSLRSDHSASRNQARAGLASGCYTAQSAAPEGARLVSNAGGTLTGEARCYINRSIL